MYASIIGDMVGSPFEFLGIKTMDFDFFNAGSLFTDDSVMTVAIAEGIMNAGADSELDVIRESMISSMVKLGRMYSFAGYGSAFFEWLYKRNPKPYGSYGNGSAMRVGSIAYFYPDNLKRALSVARVSAEVSHNHPEGIKGAECTTEIIWLANKEVEKEEIRKIVEEKYYILDKTCDEIRLGYKFDVSCQGTLPVAIQCFLEGNNYEDVVRLAVSMGGDADTLGCIAGSMAGAFYGVPEYLKKMCRRNLQEQNAKHLLEIMDRYEWYLRAREDEQAIPLPEEPKRKKSHNMTIKNRDVFLEISKGIRVYEIRLYDDKRKEILPDDYITFKCEETEEKCIVKVKSLHIYSNIDELTKVKGEHYCDIKDLRKYYSEEELEDNPIVVIRLLML